MIERPQSIYCSEDIPLKFKEHLEQNEILSSDENILLIYQKIPLWKQFKFKDRYNAIVLTNLRIFQYVNGKIKKYIFLNDIRLFYAKKKGLTKLINFQLVDGSNRLFEISDKKAIDFFKVLFDAILHYRFYEVVLLLQSDMERFRNDILKIFSANKEMEKIWLKVGEELLRCKAKKNETLTDMILRILQPKSKFSKAKKIWENRLNFNEIRKRMIYWSKQSGLKLPDKF